MKYSFFIAFTTVLFWSCNSNKPKQTSDNINKSTVDITSFSINYIDDMHERLTVKNYDMGLIDFINSNPNKVDSVKRVVYLLPFGNMKPEIEKLIRSEVDYLQAFLQLEVKVLDRIIMIVSRN